MHYSNRTKYQGKDIRVARNHEEVESPNDALYIRVGNYTSGKMTTFHPDDARTIAAALIEAADEFDAAVEAAKPSGEDFVNALPIGSRFRWSGQPTSQYWIKVAQDDVRLYGSTLGLSDFGRPATDFGHRNDFYVVED